VKRAELGNPRVSFELADVKNSVPAALFVCLLDDAGGGAREEKTHESTNNNQNGRLATRKLLLPIAVVFKNPSRTRDSRYTSRYRLTIPMMYLNDLQYRPCSSMLKAVTAEAAGSSPVVPAVHSKIQKKEVRKPALSFRKRPRKDGPPAGGLSG
jgi:hypothetical protein